jgi:hypothetical protein
MAKTKKTTKKAAAKKVTSKKAATKKAAAKKTTGAAAAKAKAYRPFYKYARPARAISAESTSLESTGDQLQSASRGPDALTALRRFLKQQTPPNEEYQDGFHRNRVRAARFELMRLEYLHGNVAAGDKLLAQLQDVDGDEGEGE